MNIEIFEGTSNDAQVWQDHVQPYIRTANRLDSSWNWPQLFTTTVTLEAARGRRVSLFCMNVPNATNGSVPLAIMLLSEGYPALDGTQDGSVFLWYLASAPSTALQHLGFVYNKPSMVVPALVDTAIQRSYELGYDGRVGLHAAMQGGDTLYCIYRDQTRMTALGGGAKISLVRRLTGLTGGNGRYFWCDPKMAQTLSNSLNYLR